MFKHIISEVDTEVFVLESKYSVIREILSLLGSVHRLDFYELEYRANAHQL